MSLENVARIEDRIDKVAAGATAISMTLGGVQFQSMIELMEFAKLMAVSGAAVPNHLRGNPGTCLAICTRALRFGFDPFALAEHSFSMKKRQKIECQEDVPNGRPITRTRYEEIETVAYDSFVIHAIIEAHAPLTGRLRMTFEGEGDERTCTVSATPRGEKEPLVIKSATLGACKARIGKNEQGYLKGSPLWETKPDQQLAYDTRRDFCRRYFPEVLLGWYDKEEFDEHNVVTIEHSNKPDIATRLKKREGSKGFAGDNVDRALEHKPAVPFDAGATKQPEPVTIDNTAPAAEAQMELSAGDVETELAAKKQAIDRVETRADLLTIVATVTDFLKANKRTDLLGDFLTYADRRGKKLKDSA